MHKSTQSHQKPQRSHRGQGRYLLVACRYIRAFCDYTGTHAGRQRQFNSYLHLFQRYDKTDIIIRETMKRTRKTKRRKKEIKKEENQEDCISWWCLYSHAQITTACCTVTGKSDIIGERAFHTDFMQ